MDNSKVVRVSEENFDKLLEDLIGKTPVDSDRIYLHVKKPIYGCIWGHNNGPHKESEEGSEVIYMKEERRDKEFEHMSDTQLSDTIHAIGSRTSGNELYALYLRGREEMRVRGLTY